MCLYLAHAEYIFAVISNNQTFSVMEKKTEQRKHFLHCNIAGFTYWDGCMALGQLEIGSPLEMVRDEDNKHDPDAVALYFKDYKLGYIPAHANETISQLLDMGYGNIFEVYVNRICKEAHPESQVHINVYIKRNVK